MVEVRHAAAFVDIKIHVRFKLFALWSSVMFFYIYGDYFELHQPGKLQDMIAGRMPFGAISQGVLLGMAAVMVIHNSALAHVSRAVPMSLNPGSIGPEWTRLGLQGNFVGIRKLMSVILLRGKSGEPGRTRTCNPLIKSQLLYH
jgi:hypothetical protein